jgi:hypothetical protein
MQQLWHKLLTPIVSTVPTPHYTVSHIAGDDCRLCNRVPNAFALQLVPR